MKLSPELDLLERLTGTDQPLHTVWIVFGGPTDPTALVRARKVLTIYIQAGVVQLLHTSGEEMRPLKEWEVRQVLADEANWFSTADDSPRYRLCLTDQGYERFVEDSRGFYTELFA